MVEYISRNIHIVQPKDPPRVKILVMGESGVGKSSILTRFSQSRFDGQVQPTIGVDYFRSQLGSFNINFWDLSGNPEFFEVRNEFYKETHGIILVYDITNRKSFDSLDMWLREANRYGASSVPLCLCGNKTDLSNRRAVHKNDAESWAHSRRFDFFEVSAATGQSIPEMIEKFIYKLRT